jgi:hypothetical protein
MLEVKGLADRFLRSMYFEIPPIIPYGEVVGSPLEAYLSVVVLGDQVEKVIQKQI